MFLNSDKSFVALCLWPSSQASPRGPPLRRASQEGARLATPPLRMADEGGGVARPPWDDPLGEGGAYVADLAPDSTPFAADLR